MKQKHSHKIVTDYITKIEGHGFLNIKFEEHEARLTVLEGERLFEGFLLERNYLDAPFITARICGVCPTVHSLTSICALEKALGIEVSPETETLRRFLLAGQMVQSHALHIFFLALPDYLDVESVLEIAGKYPDEFHIALNLKRFGDKLITMIGGRAVHPITLQVSGFDRLPSEEQLNELLDDAKGLMDEAEQAVALFGKLAYPDLVCTTQYLASMKKDEYATYNAYRIASSQGKDFEVVDYDKNIKEVVKQYSTAKFSTKDKQGFMVGALARMNIGKDLLNTKAKEVLANLPVVYPSSNPFHNNLSQAVEILHFLEEIIMLLNQLLAVDMNNARTFDYEIKAGYGVGACEAPRGTLYHAYEINKQGMITKCNIITPTAQNLTNIEEDAGKLLEETTDLDQEKRRHLLDMLVRAYDPCITCSVH